jgi:hypothetical protein
MVSSSRVENTKNHIFDICEEEGYNLRSKNIYVMT